MSTAQQKWKESSIIHLCIAVTFFTSGLIINFVQLLLHVFLKPFNKRLFRKLMNCLCYSLYSQFIFVSDWYANSKVHVFIDDDFEKNYLSKENALLIMNHSYEVDWLAGFMFAEKIGLLGNCKSYAKKDIKYVPVIGWAWYFAECVFLERSFEKDRETIARQIKEVYSYPDPTSLLLLAEGTRFTEQKHKASVDFAKERGMTVLKHHLVPRSKGFIATLPSLRGRCPAIYDFNLAFKKNAEHPATTTSILNGKPIEGFLYVRRIPLEDVPENEEKAAAWLQNLYEEKDKLIDSFHSTGSFFKTSGYKEAPIRPFKKRLRCFVNFFVWAVLSISFIAYYILSSLICQNWIGFSVAVAILAIFYIMTGRLINVSKISKASNYGNESRKN